MTEPTTASDTALPTAVVNWIVATIGGVPVELDRIPGGNRRQAWLVDPVGEASGWPPLFLYYFPGGGAPDEIYTIDHEAAVYRALTGQFAALPPLVGVHPDGVAMLTQRVAGSPAYHRLSEQRRATIADELMCRLADLHRINAAAVGFPNADRGGTMTTHVAAEIARWDRLYRATGRTDPLIELAFAWLDDNRPETDVAAVIVHGDAGPGNFLFDDSGVTALIDWELSHLGDPLEDLGWLSMRSVFETVPDFAARLTAYADASGQPVDLVRLRYLRVLVELKVVIIRHRAGDDPSPNGDVANGLISRVTNRRLLVEALADAAGRTLPVVEPPELIATQRDWLYEAVLNVVRDDIVPRSTDPLVIARAKSVARIVKHLREADRGAATFDPAERDALESLLGGRFDDLAAGRAALADAIRSRAIDVLGCLDHFAGVVARETTLMRPALGAIADRHLPALPS